MTRKERIEQVRSMHDRAMELFELALMEHKNPSGNKIKMLSNLKLAYRLENQAAEIAKDIKDNQPSLDILLKSANNILKMINDLEANNDR